MKEQNLHNEILYLLGKLPTSYIDFYLHSGESKDEYENTIITSDHGAK